MPKRNRLASFLLMPIAVFIWFVGWILCCVGSKHEATISKPKLSVQKGPEVFVPTLEQKYAT
jgi:hypothetical protein